jgi:hypothetical protein
MKLCICVVHVYKRDFGYRTFIFVLQSISRCETLLGKKTKLSFKKLLFDNGYSEKLVDELWKWYDFSEKKGVASF